MAIQTIKPQKEIQKNKSIIKVISRLQHLIEVLDKKNISENDLKPINEQIITINLFEGSEKEYKKAIKKANSEILNYVKKKFQYTPNHHYLALGLIFGVFIGLIFPQIFNGFEFGGSTISLGMLLGICIGAALDKRAHNKGLQLDIETNF